MSAYNLDNDEAVIMQTSGVSDGSMGNVDLILTNKSLIQVNKGLLGGTKGILKYPLTDLKTLNGKANVLIGVSKKGGNQLELYFTGYEKFFTLGRASESKWANAIIKAHKQRLAALDNSSANDKGSISKTLKGALDLAMDRIPIKKDILPKTNKCPKCGAELTGLKGTEAVCSYCDTRIIIK